MHLSLRLKCTIVITPCPSICPSVVNFSHFRLLLWHCLTEFNKTWQQARSHCLLPSLCFSGGSEKQDGHFCLWLAETIFRLLFWNRWTEFKETWQQARSQCPLPSLSFSGRSEKQDGRPCFWLFETFSTSSPIPLNRIQRNLTGSKISTSSTKFVFFRPIGKTRWPSWPLIGWDIFNFSTETTEHNSTKLDSKQDLNVLYQVYVFWADWKKKRWPPWPLIGWDIFNFSSESNEQNSTKLDRKQDLKVFYQVCVFRADQKNKMAALASDWLRHFGLLLWNCWKEFNETWQEARSQRPLPSSCFFGLIGKQDGRPGLWLAETFSTSTLKLLNGIERNLTRSKISMSSIKFVFFLPILKTRWSPWLLIGWDVSTSPLKLLNGFQRNLTGSKISTSSTKFVCFRLISKQKGPPWSIPLKGGTLNSGARYVALWASCYAPGLKDLLGASSNWIDHQSVCLFICPFVCL